MFLLYAALLVWHNTLGCYIIDIIISSDFLLVSCSCVGYKICVLQGYIRCLYSGKLQVIMWERCTWKDSMNIVIFLWVLLLCTQVKWTLIKHLSLYLVSMPEHARSEYVFIVYLESELFISFVTFFMHVRWTWFRSYIYSLCWLCNLHMYSVQDSCDPSWKVTGHKILYYVFYIHVQSEWMYGVSCVF